MSNSEGFNRPLFVYHSLHLEVIHTTVSGEISRESTWGVTCYLQSQWQSAVTVTPVVTAGFAPIASFVLEPLTTLLYERVAFRVLQLADSNVSGGRARAAPSTAVSFCGGVSYPGLVTGRGWGSRSQQA